MCEISRQHRFSDVALLVAFPIRKEECAIATDRSAQSKTKLSPLKEWILIRTGGKAAERGICRQLMIAKIVKRRAMEIVGPRACDDIDGSCKSQSRGKIEIDS